MLCEEFQNSYRAMISRRIDEDDPREEEWHDHLHACRGCGDWYEEQQVRDRGADPTRYPCVHLAYHLTQTCRQHEDPWECPDHVIVYNAKYDEYGIPIRDGGSSQVLIRHCPWCGIELPTSKRDLWFETLVSLGYEDPWEQDVPEEFESDRW